MNFTLDKKTYKPLSKNGKISGRQRLLLTFEKGKTRETIIEYVPSKTFTGDIKEINSGNFKSKQFDGEVSFKNPKDNYTMVWVLSKGVVNKKLKRTSSITKQKKTSKTATSLATFVVTVKLNMNLCCPRRRGSLFKLHIYCL